MCLEWVVFNCNFCATINVAWPPIGSACLYIPIAAKFFRVVKLGQCRFTLLAEPVLRHPQYLIGGGFPYKTCHYRNRCLADSGPTVLGTKLGRLTRVVPVEWEVLTPTLSAILFGIDAVSAIERWPSRTPLPATPLTNPETSRTSLARLGVYVGSRPRSLVRSLVCLTRIKDMRRRSRNGRTAHGTLNPTIIENNA